MPDPCFLLLASIVFWVYFIAPASLTGMSTIKVSVIEIP
jgi:hypothetical protein